MPLPKPNKNPKRIDISPISQDTWRAVANLEVSPDQQEFVAAPSYYLALCCYGGTWQPLAISLDGQIIGFCMWGIDPGDASCWLGGILIDTKYQGRGYGKRAVKQLINWLNKEHGFTNFALSYKATNLVAKHIYGSLGFNETGEQQEDEIVARLEYPSDT